MNKSKKRIIIVSIIISLILIITGTVILIYSNDEQQVIEEKSIQENYDTSKLISIKEKLQNGENYTVSLTLNDENKKTITRNGEQAKIEVVDEGEKTTYVVKENTTYMVLDNNKTYEYKNQSSMLYEFENQIGDITLLKFATGTEEINGKKYTYEEFEQSSIFLINFKGTIDRSKTKTRVYFDKDELKYVKTYVGDVEQLLKVEISY